MELSGISKMGLSLNSDVLFLSRSGLLSLTTLPYVLVEPKQQRFFVD